MYMRCSLLLWFLLMIVASAPYTVSHIDHTISWITSNLNDASVIYLGNKANSGECEASCKDLNYLCDKSESDISLSDGASFSFNNADCEITINGGSEPFIGITPNLISTQYRIDVELNVISGFEPGIYFKSNNAIGDQYLDYYIGIDPLDGVVLGRDDPNWVVIAYGNNNNNQPQFNTKYTVSVDVDGDSFTTYFDGVPFYTGSFLPKWVDSYAGIYNSDASVIYYSYKLNISDGEGDKVCAAYVMDKNSGDCYGYYGAEYTQMENTLSPNNNYDAAIIYPFLPATNDPSATQTAVPSYIPSFNPIETTTYKINTTAATNITATCADKMQISVSFNYTLQNETASDLSHIELKNLLRNISTEWIQNNLQDIAGSNCVMDSYFILDVKVLNDAHVMIEIVICFVCEYNAILRAESTTNELEYSFLQTLQQNNAILIVIAGSTKIEVDVMGNDKERRYEETSAITTDYGDVDKDKDYGESDWVLYIKVAGATVVILCMACGAICVMKCRKKRLQSRKDKAYIEEDDDAQKVAPVKIRKLEKVVSTSAVRKTKRTKRGKKTGNVVDDKEEIEGDEAQSNDLWGEYNQPTKGLEAGDRAEGESNQKDKDEELYGAVDKSGANTRGKSALNRGPPPPRGMRSESEAMYVPQESVDKTPSPQVPPPDAVSRKNIKFQHLLNKFQHVDKDEELYGAGAKTRGADTRGADGTTGTTHGVDGESKTPQSNVKLPKTKKKKKKKKQLKRATKTSPGLTPKDDV